mgnify:FL=1
MTDCERDIITGSSNTSIEVWVSIDPSEKDKIQDIINSQKIYGYKWDALDAVYPYNGSGVFRVLVNLGKLSEDERNDFIRKLLEDERKFKTEI